MKRIIIVGSPRSNGRSAHVAEMLFEANIDERPQDELFLVPVSEVEVGPCIGCGGCRELAEVTVTGEDGQEQVELRPRCVFDDDMQTLYDLIDDADELTIVSPVYFSGAPAMLKCLLDRLQPYYWANARAGAKRPATLHVLGEGGDPHGYGALVSEVRSSLACAGFSLQRVLDWVGKVDEQGEITAEAVEVQMEIPAVVAVRGGIEQADAGTAIEEGAERAPKQRPKLDLSADRTRSSRQTSQKQGRGDGRASGGKGSGQGGSRGGRGSGASARGNAAAKGGRAPASGKGAQRGSGAKGAPNRGGAKRKPSGKGGNRG